MVIINSQNAQLCNRLFGFSTFIANSLTYDYPLVNIGFYKYRPFFEATKNDNFDGYPISVRRSFSSNLDYFYSNIFKTWFSFTHRKFGKTPTFKKFYHTTFSNDLIPKIFDLNEPAFVKDARQTNVLVQGWMFRDLSGLRNHRETICNFFTPVAAYRLEVQKIIERAQTKADLLIGVHIRRGDYKEFLHGQWFYNDEDYATWMNTLSKEYAAKGKTCVFLIASNDLVDINKFEGLSVVFEPRHFIVDLYMLAECDVIIGPPSTYSQWAAFYGNKPLTMLLNKNQSLNIPEYNSTLLPKEDFLEKELYRFTI